MNFAKKFLKTTPINYYTLSKSNEIIPIQYSILAPRYMEGGPVRVPHYYSNSYDKIKMRNTLDLLQELFKQNK